MKESIQHFRLSFWSLLIAIIAAIILCVIVSFVINASKPASVDNHLPTLMMTVVPLPSYTPEVIEEKVIIDTPTPDMLSQDGISLGMYVQIKGTGGDGLRLRIAPGVGSDPLFLGMEAEVFLVQDGPKLSDGYTWWFLVAPYDSSRKGWAASEYLGVVAAPATP